MRVNRFEFSKFKEAQKIGISNKMIIQEFCKQCSELEITVFDKKKRESITLPKGFLIKRQDKMNCRLCIFLEDGEVYGYFQRGTLEAKLEHNYGTAHKIELIGNYSKKEVKIMYPHASFINFNDLGNHRIEREKIIELKQLAKYD